MKEDTQTMQTKHSGFVDTKQTSLIDKLTIAIKQPKEVKFMREFELNGIYLRRWASSILRAAVSHWPSELPILGKRKT